MLISSSSDDNTLLGFFLIVRVHTVKRLKLTAECIFIYGQIQLISIIIDLLSCSEWSIADRFQLSGFHSFRLQSKPKSPISTFFLIFNFITFL